MHAADALIARHSDLLFPPVAKPFHPGHLCKAQWTRHLPHALLASSSSKDLSFPPPMHAAEKREKPGAADDLTLPSDLGGGKSY